MLHKSLLYLQVTHLVAACIVVQQAVKAYRCACINHITHLYVGLQSSRCSQTHECQLTLLLLHLACLEVNVCKSIQLRHRDIDVTDTDTC